MWACSQVKPHSIEPGTAAAGIAELVASKGTIEVLSDKQRAVWDAHIAPQLSLKCSNCTLPIPNENFLDALWSEQEHGRVIRDYCQNSYAKMMRD